MSSTTGANKVTNPDDFYETPAWCVRAILKHLPPLDGLRILEPSAGRGAIVRELLRAGATHVTAVEIDGERTRELCRPDLAELQPDGSLCPVGGDFTLCTATSLGGRFDLVVMNPPFSAAQEHVERAISLLAPGGTVAALLRLAFLASAKRAPFRKAHPFDLYPMASRPSFTPDGKTDSADYAWFLFGANHGGRFAVLEGKG